MFERHTYQSKISDFKLNRAPLMLCCDIVRVSAVNCVGKLVLGNVVRMRCCWLLGDNIMMLLTCARAL